MFTSCFFILTLYNWQGDKPVLDCKPLDIREVEIPVPKKPHPPATPKPAAVKNVAPVKQDVENVVSFRILISWATKFQLRDIDSDHCCELCAELMAECLDWQMGDVDDPTGRAIQTQIA